MNKLVVALQDAMSHLGYPTDVTVHPYTFPQEVIFKATIDMCMGEEEGGELSKVTVCSGNAVFRLGDTLREITGWDAWYICFVWIAPKLR